MLDRSIGAEQRRPVLNQGTALAVHQGIFDLTNITLGVKVLELTARTMGRPTFPAEVNRATRATLVTQTPIEDQQQAEIVADCMAIIFNGEPYYPFVRRDTEADKRRKVDIMGTIRDLRGMTTDQLREEVAIDIVRKDLDSSALLEGSEVPSLLEKFLWTTNPTPSSDVNRSLGLVCSTLEQIVTRALAEEEETTTQSF